MHITQWVSRLDFFQRLCISIFGLSLETVIQCDDRKDSKIRPVKNDLTL